MTTTDIFITPEVAKDISIWELKRLCLALSIEADEKSGQARTDLIEQYNNCATEVNDRYEREVMVIKKETADFTQLIRTRTRIISRKK